MQAFEDFNITVSEIVRADYRTADVFKKNGINYCCGGKIPLIQTCAAQNIDYNKLLQELTSATKTVSLPNILQYGQWRIDFLIDYIINVHHEYVKQTIPSLEVNLFSFVNSHKKQYSALIDIQTTFLELAALINLHTRHEEEIIFPYIKQIANAYNRKESYGSLFVRTLRKPLSNLEIEHSKIMNLLSQLRSLTNNYTFPNNACTNHRVVFQKLYEFDNDLVQHKHLENNILFPKAIELEQELLQV